LNVDKNFSKVINEEYSLEEPAEDSTIKAIKKNINKIR
jgi:hypothetical protein